MLDEEIAPPSGDVTPRQPDGQPDRLAQPIDAEQPPRLPFPVVGIGASAGGLEAVGELLGAMRPDGGMAFVLIQHLSPDHDSMMAEILGRRTAMPVAQVEDGMAVEPGHVYVIRPGHVLTIREGRLRLGPPLGTTRAANRPVDDFFRSLAEEQRERAICVVLSGMGSNGTAGAQAVKAVGGLCIAQDPDSAQFPSMPRHLIDAGYADYILAPADIPEVLLGYAGQPYVRGGREADAGATPERERRHLREVLALLRTRTGHDFSGYKKPTLLRRVQRRMGLARVASVAEYARMLRQGPAEVTALADDLLIHVTGFFRDPEAWEALRGKVIAPLVRAREPGGPVRGWVTACSSGEEAYSLAMLLVEESERAGKVLDIKVFATDLADRALAHARAGLYPGGIESEIPPGRLARFFAREDEVYRVRPELRDRVVFAPQNVLQDPPFSRLDVASCRNLLIYLEPEVQQRVLGLLHFGLREGGALFLGTSETIAGAEELFEPIDKKARIFRRVGPTRHGSIEFPPPQGIAAGGRGGGMGVAPGRGPRAGPARPGPGRPSNAELARRTLLERHTPAAVMVDRDGRIVYYHGDTRPFLQQPSGEPTRELLLLAREGVRGPARVALHRAAAGDPKAVVIDGWVDLEPGRRARVAVAASPIVADDAAPGEPAGPADYFIVSFEDRGDLAPAAGSPGAEEGMLEELRRLREELRGTIEELQASNEEMKASNEEVMSINEELQSANEELETSKEEMQSLNEELVTVNGQLQAKMGELEATANDLGSLLTSTDIAVLFLDPGFRIRRSTPAVKELLELIPSDIGRPFVDLRLKFEDPHLLADARQVLERLVPLERAVEGEGGRHYLRRVLPYRTQDDRINGVVVAFLDVTERRKVDDALRASEGRLAALVRAGAGAVYRMGPDWRRMLHLEGAGFLANSALPSESWLDHYIPPDDRPAVAQAIERAIREKAPFVLEHRVLRVDGTIGWAQSRAVPILGPDGEILEWFGAASDVTARMQAQEEVRRSEEKYRSLFGSIDEGFCIIEMIYDDAGRPADYRFLEANPAFGRHAGFAAGVGRTALELMPGHEARWFEAYGRVAETGEPARFEQQAEELGRHFDVYAFRIGPPGRPRVAVLFTDITERKRAAGRQAFLLELSDALRPMADPEAIGLEVARALGGHLGVDRALYAEVEPDEGHALIRADYTAGGMASLAGRRELGELGPPPAAGDRAGRTVAIADAGAEASGFRASVGVPVRKAGRLVGILAVHSAGPREWTPPELALVEATAERTWAAVERARAEGAASRAEARLRLALAAARMGIWTLDYKAGIHMRDANLNRLMGLEPVDSARPMAEFLGHVHPDDRGAVAAAFEVSARMGGPLNLEFRAIHPDGSVRWLRDQGDVAGEDRGEGAPLAGACVDITDLKEAEAALRAGEERLRSILQSATDYAIFTIDPDGLIASWSPGAEATFGYPEPEMIGRPADIVFTPEDRAAGALQAEVSTARRDGRADDDRWHLRKDGSRFFASGVLTRLGPDGSRGFVKVASDQTGRKRMEDALREARDGLERRVEERTAELARANEALREGMAARAELLGRLVTAQEDERRRLSRELHDGLGQELTALILGLKALERDTPEAAPGRARLLELEATVGRISREAHDLAVELRPTALDDIGLGAALVAYVERWSQRTGIAAAFEPLGLDGDRLPPEAETTIYRVVQEALNNVAKHAGARNVSVMVARHGGEIIAMIEDDGRGFDPEPAGRGAPSARRGLGLPGMRERLALVGGELRVDSAEGEGAAVRARIPLPGPPGGADDGG